MLTQLEKDLIPNIANISLKYLGLNTDSQNAYSLPYLVGSTGIAYNQGVFDRKISSWNDFFTPDEKFSGKIGIFNDGFVMIPLAMIAIGADPNSSAPDTIRKAGKIIYKLNKNGYLGLVSANVETIQKKLLDGTLAAAIMYSGDALAIYEKSNGKIKYIIPQEGSEFYVDSFVILKSSTNKRLAHKFINFCLSPEIQAANAIYLQYSCPNKKGLDIIKKIAPGQLENPAINLPENLLKKMYMFTNNDPEMQRLWKKIFH